MINRHKWIRVKPKDRCKICGKPDYCTYAPEAGLALCMRVESDRPSTNALGGWIHRTGDSPRPYVPTVRSVSRIPAIAPTPIDLAGQWERWLKKTDGYHVDGFAMSLGVDTDSLIALGCAWADREWADPQKRGWASPAWVFPMKDATGNVIGIRVRGEQGGKWAVKGSQNGLFIPDRESETDQTLWIVEGPTDCAAALTLGLNAIGRPSCSACDDLVVAFIREQKIRRAVIISDNDKPDKLGVVAGVRGAAKLQDAMPIFSCIWTPPTKDLREFLRLGGTRELIETSVTNLVWTPPSAQRRAA